MKTLSKAYDAITSSFHLLTKPEFRAKVSSALSTSERDQYGGHQLITAIHRPPSFHLGPFLRCLCLPKQFGTEQDMVYLAYPKSGLGVSGIHALVGALSE